jgi:hypothetical protein
MASLVKSSGLVTGCRVLVVKEDLVTCKFGISKQTSLKVKRCFAVDAPSWFPRDRAHLPTGINGHGPYHTGESSL